MHVPSAFAQTNLTTLFDFIEEHSFALLVSQADGHPVASHRPLLLDRDAAPHGRLVGHMARANKQWAEASEEVPAIFSRPHTYISPTWYESEKVVPTWNYLARHAYGILHIVDERPRLIEIVRDFVDFYEASLPRPWSIEDVDDQFVDGLVDRIVGFHIDITGIEGKWKLNQNQPASRRKKVAGHLSARDDENSLAIAKLMEEML